MKLSIIIPAYKEPYLQRTIDSLLETSELGSDLEIFVVLDGPWLDDPIKNDPRVKVIRFDFNRGMRKSVNVALSQATGEYVLKLDAHCSFAQGFDRIMVENCDENWLVIPRRYSIDEINWTRDKGRAIKDYHFLSYPLPPSRYGYAMTPQVYGKHYRGNGLEIDDTMTYQGSCWMVNRNFFLKRFGFMDDRPETYGPFASEMLEVGLKYWLGGGEVKVNKKTWYAHLSKMPRHYASGGFVRHYKGNLKDRYTWAAQHWINNEEPGMIHPFSWLVEKFWPVSTWPEDRTLWRLDI